MTIYYVRTTGDDDNDGLSPAAAWATIGFALSADGIASGDTVYIGAGVYREMITVAMTSATAETFVIGDVDGSHTGDAGEVRLTNYLTDDTTAPSGGNLIDLAGCDYLTFKNIVFFFITPGYGTAVLYAYDSPSEHITCSNCAFVMGGAGNTTAQGIQCIGDVDAPAAWLIDRCWFLTISTTSPFYVAPLSSETETYDFDFVVQNCLFVSLGNDAILYVEEGGDTYTYGPYGIKFLNNICFSAVTTIKNLMDAPTEITAYNNIIFHNSEIGGRAALHVENETAGSILSDYNYILSNLPYFGVTPGAHDVSDGSIAPLVHFGQELIAGLMCRPLGMPTADSPLLGFGNAAGAPTVDLLNRPRPAGGQITNAIGALERHDTAIREDTTADATPGIKIVGPGDHEFQIPIDATATTISIKARYNAAHDTTNKPQAILLANPSIGVTAETLTMAAAVDTWETLAFAAQTPSAKGVVRVRLVSRAAAANGIAYFDTFAVV